MHRGALMSSCSKLMLVPVPHHARTITRMGACCTLALSALAVAGCGESDAARSKRLKLMDEAREVGFAMGIAERCGLEHPWTRGMPSAYDDSLDGWKVASAFQSGYAESRAIDRPCIHGIAGRPPRTY